MFFIISTLTIQNIYSYWMSYITGKINILKIWQGQERAIKYPTKFKNKSVEIRMDFFGWYTPRAIKSYKKLFKCSPILGFLLKCYVFLRHLRDQEDFLFFDVFYLL